MTGFFCFFIRMDFFASLYFSMSQLVDACVSSRETVFRESHMLFGMERTNVINDRIVSPMVIRPIISTIKILMIGVVNRIGDRSDLWRAIAPFL